MSKIFTATIDLTKVSKENIFKPRDGSQLLNLRIVIYDKPDANGKDLLIGQVFLKEFKKDSEGNYITTPLLGNGNLKKTK